MRERERGEGVICMRRGGGSEEGEEKAEED